MSRRYLRQIWFAIAIAGCACAITATAPAAPSPPIVADFESYVNFAGNADCPVSSGAVLVEGRGVATGPFGKFGSAIGTAAECSAPPGGPPPQLGTCNNIQPGHSFFDVHGKGVYVTKDGSVLALVYHELSENPFELFPLPFYLHDCGIWQVDTANSTGIFAGATGHGSISAVVPIRTDFSAHVNATYTADANGAITLAPNARSPKGNLDVHCNGPMSGPFPGNVIVDANSFCSLDAATVNGDVRAGKNSSLVMQYSIAAGDVNCDHCGSPNLFATTALGGVRIDHGSAGGSVVSSIVGKDLVVSHTDGAVSIVLNYSVGGDLRFNHNTGASTVAANTVARDLTCDHNTPAPVETFTVPFPPQFGPPLVLTGNNARALKGQCTVFGLGPQPPPGA